MTRLYHRLSLWLSNCLWSKKFDVATTPLTHASTGFLGHCWSKVTNMTLDLLIRKKENLDLLINFMTNVLLKNEICWISVTKQITMIESDWMLLSLSLYLSRSRWNHSPFETFCSMHKSQIIKWAKLPAKHQYVLIKILVDQSL